MVVRGEGDVGRGCVRGTVCKVGGELKGVCPSSAAGDWIVGGVDIEIL